MRGRHAPARPGVLGPIARLAAAAAIGVAAHSALQRPDERARALLASRRIEALDRALPVFTDLGSMYAVAGASAVLWLRGRRKLARDVAGAAAAAWGISQVAKTLFARPRPYDLGSIDVLVRRPMGRSYPSGHPAVAGAVSGVLAPEVRQPLRGALARLPRAVAFSRVYVGVHYPSDVIGGILIGRAVGDLWRRFAPAPRSASRAEARKPDPATRP